MNEKEYYNLIKPYEDAMQMLLSRLDTLNHTLYESSATHPVPIHNIQSRIKSKKSIEDKLIKKEKKDSLFACYLFFCLSLRHYYFRYLRSNSYLHTLVISTLYHYSVLQSNSLRKINSFY